MAQPIYLDHAATSFPKPPAVSAAVLRWFTELGVSADRGDGDACAVVAAEVSRVRARIGRSCGVPAQRVAFCSGATEAIHLFLNGYLRPGMRVLTTEFEHSSVVRPLLGLRDHLPIDLDVLTIGPDGDVPDDAVRTALAAHPVDLFVFSHASNVTGRVTPARRWSDLARDAGCATLCDASQTAGLLPLDVGADAIVASAHKSLLGPPGLGFLAVRAGVMLRTVKPGGSGSSIALERHPTEWPNALEAGTPNTPAIFGLGAALDWLDQRGPNEPLEHGLAVCAAIEDVLQDRVRWHAPRGDRSRVPILSCSVPGFEPAEFGAMLASLGVHVRTGFHCAPWVHRSLGTTTTGTVRISPGPFVNAAAAAAACSAWTT